MSTKNLTFSQALETILKDRTARVRREGWNGKRMWLRMYWPGTDYQFGYKELPLKPDQADSGTMMPYVALKSAQNQFAPWTPSQLDMISSDWEVVDPATELRL